MRILIKQIKKRYDDRREPEEVLLDHFNADLKDIVILKESLDARQKNRPYFIYSFAATTNDESLLGHRNVSRHEDSDKPVMDQEIIQLDKQPIIIGAGPAGLFAALALLQKGYRPIIFDRGKDIANRIKDVRNFFQNRNFHPHSNIAFGEGGAGTYSDGKLTTRSTSWYTKTVLETLIENGAPQKICYQAKPHLGTDRLRHIIINMRKQIEQQGGKFYFNSFIEDIQINDQEIATIFINGKSKQTNSMILAIGNSATDTYELLFHHKVSMAIKPYAVGVRVEHPQKFINVAQYGSNVNMNLLEAAEYILTYQYKPTNKGVYSFCMCPGGKIICASSHPNRLVLNGMSYSTRNLPLSNSAIVVTVNDKDFRSDSPLSALKFRDEIEQRAFLATPLPYQAPAQKIIDFMEGKISTSNISSSYPLGILDADITQILPNSIIQSLKEAFINFDHQIKGFVHNGILLAPETRTSAPVRILRDPETFCSVNTKGLFPIGEGSGYAGGIVSSAADALRFVARVKSLE